MLWLAFLTAGISVAVFVLLTGTTVKHFRDLHDISRLPFFVVVFGISAILSCLVIVPADIYLASFDYDKTAALTTIEVLYYTGYSISFLYVFLVLPFAYWFNVEYDEIVSLPRRLFGGVRWTVLLFIVLVVLLVLGCLWRPEGASTVDANTKAWVKYLVSENMSLENGILFVTGCLTLLALLCWCLYTAYGLAAFPLVLIKGTRRQEKDINALNRDLENNKNEAREIHSKYVGGRTIPQEDQERLKLLKRQEKILEKETQRHTTDKSRFWKLILLARRYSIIFGVLFLLVSILVIVSLIISQVNSIMYSDCGITCGFMLAHPDIPNPIDGFLVALAPYFPLDYFVYILVVLYLIACTIYALQRIGVRLLCLPLATLESHKTVPQGMLMSCLVVILCLLGLNMELPAFAPQYITFGGQTWLNTTQEIECNVNAPVTPNCTMSEVGKFTTMMGLDLNVFGHALFWSVWLFVLVWILGFVHVIVLRKRAWSHAKQNKEEPVMLDASSH